jgi:Ca2+-binding RTX toxin-like protein
MAINSDYSVSDPFFSTSGQNPFGSGAGAQSAVAPLTVSWNDSQTVGLDDGLASAISTGVSATFSTSGRVGAEVGVVFDPGEVSASPRFDANASLPERFTIAAGTPFNIAPDETVNAAEFEVSPRLFDIFFDMIFEASGSVNGSAKLVGADVGSFSQTLFNIQESVRLFSINGTDPLLPAPNVDFLGITTLPAPADAPDLNLLAKFNAVDKTPELDINGIPVFPLPPKPGVSIEVGNLALEFAEGGAKGTLTNGSVQASTTNQIADLDLDLDGLFAFFKNIPLDFSVTLIPVILGLTGTVIDVDAGPTVSLEENYSFDPRLAVDLAFSAPVIINSQTVTEFSGFWNVLPNIELIEEVTTITPTFRQGGEFGNYTDLLFGLDLTARALAASLQVNLSPIFDTALGVGPVFQTDIGKADFFSTNLLNTGGVFDGFGEIQAPSITLVTPGSLINPGIDDGVNDAPEALADEAMTDEDTAIVFTDRDLFSNDFDIDAFDVLDVVGLDLTDTIGLVTLGDSTVTFDPRGLFDGLKAGQSTIQTFDYVLEDAGGLQSTATVSITINGVNDTPEDIQSAGDMERAATTVITVAELNISDKDDASSNILLTVTSAVERGDLLLDDAIIGIGATFTMQDVLDGKLAYAHDNSLPGRDGFDFTAENPGEAGTLITGRFDMRIVTPPGGLNLVGDSDADNFSGSNVADRFIGAAGDDQLVGNGGADAFNAGFGDDRISGGDGDDFIIASFGDDEATGDAGDDTILGGPGDDRLFGNAGDDLLNAGPGNNQAFGGDGDDKIKGGNQTDRIFGEAGDDQIDAFGGSDEIFGGAGDDTINAGAGDDRVFGEDGVDFLVGANGDDDLRGGSGNDILIGAAGDDVMFGDSGADRLLGLTGDDEMTGGAGRDVFVFSAGSGDDVIIDFRSGEDVIRINGGIATSVADLAFATPGNDQEITLATGDTITLQNLAGVTLAASDFVFG